MKRLTPQAVLDDGLLQAVTALFGLDTLDSGERVRRDERGWMQRDDQGRRVLRPVARSLWVAEVRPAHLDPVCLAVATIEECRLAGCVIQNHPWVAEYPPGLMPIVPPMMVPIGPVIVDVAWADPVTASLGHLEEWPQDEGVVLDGRAYALFAGHGMAEIALAFVNPATPALQAVEESLMQVAQMLTAHDETGTLARYVEQWTRDTQAAH